jgi:hypothetical protein
MAILRSASADILTCLKYRGSVAHGFRSRILSCQMSKEHQHRNDAGPDTRRVSTCTLRVCVRFPARRVGVAVQLEGTSSASSPALSCRTSKWHRRPC